MPKAKGSAGDQTETRRPGPGEMEIQTRAAMVGTVDAEARTVEVVWTTGASVRRRRYDFRRDRVVEYDEILVVSAEAVDLSRLENGAPVLNTHGQYDLADVIGVVEKAWLAGGEGRATLRFSDREDVEPIFRDVEAGIIRNVSVGYQVRRVEITEAANGDPDEYRVVDWLPMEISLVPIGADAAAGTRGAERIFPCEFTTTRAIAHDEEVSDMTVRNKPGAVPGDASGGDAAVETAAAGGQVETRAAPAGQAVEAAAAGGDREALVRAERERAATVRQRCRSVGLDDEFADALVARGLSVESSAEQIVDALAARGSQGRPPAASVQVGAEATERFAEGVTLALQMRAGLPGGERNEFSGLTLRELARGHLALRGVAAGGLSAMDLVGRAFTYRSAGGGHSSSDFPSILGNVASKALMRGYEEAGETFPRWTSPTTLSDFKVADRVDLNAFPSLAEVPEGGEYSLATIGERKEQIQLATYGKKFSITRQAIINDDLDAFTRVPQRMGRAAIRTVGNLVYAILTANPLMADGKALFHADHKNLAGSGGALAVATLDAGRVAMGTQKDRSDSATALNLSPAYLLVPKALEGTGRVLMASEFDPAKTQRTPNSVAGMAEVVPEARLDAASATAWFLAANPMATDTIEVGYLDGQQSPTLEQRDGWDVDGVEFKVRMDATAKAVAWEGLYKNAGA
ncbi:MAG: prohead protease/major capsid protein fusion protein [Alphaproteobacteria bacterium]